MSSFRSWADWQERLSAKSLEAFEDCCFEPNEIFSNDEILDRVVRYQGGVACGSEIRVLVAEIYGVLL